MANDAIENVRNAITAAVQATQSGARRELSAVIITTLFDALARSRGLNKKSRYQSWDTPGTTIDGTFINTDWLIDYRGVRHQDGTTTLFPVASKQLREAVQRIPDGAYICIAYAGTANGNTKRFVVVADGEFISVPPGMDL